MPTPDNGRAREARCPTCKLPARRIVHTLPNLAARVDPCGHFATYTYGRGPTAHLVYLSPANAPRKTQP